MSFAGNLAFMATDVPVTNLVKEPLFKNNSPIVWRPNGGASYTEDKGVATIYNTTNNANPGIYQTISVSSKSVIYYSGNVKTDNDNGRSYIGLGTNNGRYFSNKEFETISGTGIVTSSTQFYIMLSLGLGNTIPSDVTMSVKEPLIINLTETFGAGNEPTNEQMDKLLLRFPNSWFDGTVNLFNAKEFMIYVNKELEELRNAVTFLGGNL